jgi:NADPH:quinone reductase-like Zn-dependent oxidoreductase
VSVIDTCTARRSVVLALRRRVPIEAGQSVLVLGATGNGGRMAIQIANRLGAGRVVGAGRDQARLASLSELGADATVALDAASALAAVASEVDLVFAYLWGAAIMALLRARTDRGRPLNWIQIGSVAGPTIELPSVALRSANLPSPHRRDRQRRPRGHRSDGGLRRRRVRVDRAGGPGRAHGAGARTPAPQGMATAVPPASRASAPVQVVQLCW